MPAGSLASTGARNATCRRCRLEGELAANVEQGLVPTALLAAGAFGRHLCGEEWQGPDPSGPRDGGEQH